MTVTSNDIVNQAIQFIGDDQPPVQGQSPTFDSSKAGTALQKLYAPCVATVARQFGWDFARNSVALTVSGNVAPFPWAQEYLYPGNGVEIWQLMPAALTDANNPLPINWSVGNAQVGGNQTKVIWSNLAAARAFYNNNPSENLWDSGFREAVVRLLASELAMALAGKPDTMQNLLESAGQFETIGEHRGEN